MKDFIGNEYIIGGYVALNLMNIKTKQCYATVCAIDWKFFKKVL